MASLNTTREARSRTGTTFPISLQAKLTLPPPQGTTSARFRAQAVASSRIETPADAIQSSPDLLSRSNPTSLLSPETTSRSTLPASAIVTTSVVSDTVSASSVRTSRLGQQTIVSTPSGIPPTRPIGEIGANSETFHGTSSMRLNSDESLLSASASTMTTFVTAIRPMQTQATLMTMSAMATVAMSDSTSGPLSTALTLTSMRTLPSGIPQSPQQNNAPDPFIRTVFIVFGTLGGIAVMIALGSIILMQIRKRRLLTLTPTPKRYRGRRSRGVELENIVKDPSANSMEVNPSLSASEQAIIQRAASTGNSSRLTLNLSGSTSFSEAINGFVNKSRNVSYKMGP